jgi:hypothetical protein
VIAATEQPPSNGSFDDLVMRPIRPSDAERRVRFHEGLSDETTRLRFFHPHPHLSARELARFAGVDGHDRAALIVLRGDDIIGVARFDRLRVGGDEAEVAFVVADQWQGHVALALPENRHMLDLLQHTGLAGTRRFEDGAVRVELDLGPSTAES